MRIFRSRMDPENAYALNYTVRILSFRTDWAERIIRAHQAVTHEQVSKRCVLSVF